VRTAWNIYRGFSAKAQIILAALFVVLCVVSHITSSAEPASAELSQECLAGQRLYANAAGLSVNAQFHAYEQMLFLCDGTRPIGHNPTP
jgi:hypothetical protein